MKVSLGYKVIHCNSIITKGTFDGVVIVGEDLTPENYPEFAEPYISAITKLAQHDKAAENEVTALAVSQVEVPLVVWSPTGQTNRDYDDSRRYKDAADKGLKRALKAGMKEPALVVYSSSKQQESTLYKDILKVTIFGAMEAVYTPIEVREAFADKPIAKITKLGIASKEIVNNDQASKLIKETCGVEYGRILARDIGGSDPERMAAANVAKYVQAQFNDTSVKVTVTEKREDFVKDYPLFAAVDRCSSDRHVGRIIYLEYVGDGDVEQTYMFVGKGVTYDTGGADVKAGGVMAGMHRDKCGAATVAGIFGMLAELKPAGVKVVGRMAMVRNSIGSECYVADEIITSAAGVRVRVGNTDAEGRMAMTDPLFHSKQQALNEVNPHLFTIATLTGHAVIAMGSKYTIVMDNGPAKKVEMATKLQELGEVLSDPFEISTIRREDYAFVDGRNEYEDLIQCNNSPSSRTPRGHQFPAAFMISASGLSKHGIDSKQPLKYSHMDIAGSSGDYPGIPTAAPMLSLARMMKML